MAIRNDVTRWLRQLALLGVLLSSSAALAEPAEGFIQPAATVQSRIFSLTGKNEIGVFGAFSLNNILTQFDGGTVTYDHNFNEYIALEVIVGGGYGGLTNLAQSLRQTDGAFNHSNTTDLTNGGALLAYGQIGARLTPLYGKINLASELPVHFDLYLNAGVGAALVDYNSILGCNEDVSGAPLACPNNDFHQYTGPAFAFSAGGGLRLFITQLVSIRLEIHDIIFQDRYYQGINLSMSQGQFTNANLYSHPGLTNAPLMLAGVGFLL